MTVSREFEVTPRRRQDGVAGTSSETKKPTVLLLITELGFGGTPRFVESLAVGLDRSRYRVVVASLFSKRGIAGAIADHGIPVYGLGIERSTLRGIIGLWSLLKAERPRVLHAFNFHANLLGRVVGRLARVPVILASERSVESTKSRHRVLADRLTWWLADRWCVNADAVGETLIARERIGRDRVVRIYSGIDITTFSPPIDAASIRRTSGFGPCEFVIVSVGRLDRYKGQETLLGAIKLLSAEGGRRWRVVFVGDGPRRSELQHLADRLRLTDIVHFAGSASDVRPWLAAADVFVLSSDEEGLPMSVLEAMAMAKPIVATAVGGTTELIEHDIDGILVPRRSPEHLAQALRRLRDEPAVRAKIGEVARTTVEQRFKIARMIDETQALYASLLRDRGAVC